MNFVTSDFYYDFSTDLFPNCTYNASKLGGNGFTASSTLSIGEAPDSLHVNPDSNDYFSINRSEMIKQALRLLQYSYETKTWWTAMDSFGDPGDIDPINEAEGRYMSSTINSTANRMPPLSNYLFDYISLEYEFWDDNEYNKFTAIPLTITKERLAWNTFTDVSDAIFFVYKKMCSYINTELEFQLVPQKLDGTIPNYDPLEGFFDPNWGNIPPTEVQIAFLTKYYNRVLLSCYKNGTPTSINNNVLNNGGIISKTDVAQTIFAQNQGSVGSNRNLIVPLFSAEGFGFPRHEFGVLGTGDPTIQPFLGDLLKLIPPHATLSLLNTSHPLYSDPSAGWGGWGDNIYTPNSLAYFEHEFMMQTHEAVLTGRICQNCESYSDLFNFPTGIPCPFSNINNKIAGYMWFKYEFLNHPYRAPNEFHRLAGNTKDSSIVQFINVGYNQTDSKLKIEIDEGMTSQQMILSIFDINGKNVFEQSIPNKSNSIYLGNLLTGIYAYTIFNESKAKTGKIIILK
jgi:hypothetical protein